MKIEERAKDLRAQKIIEKLINELYNVFNDKKSILKPDTLCLDYGRTNEKFYVKGSSNYDEASNKKAKKSGIKENDKVIPIGMIINLHNFMTAHVPGYEAIDNFPKIIIGFKDKSNYGYSGKTNTIYIIFPEKIRKNLKKYLDSFSHILNPVEIFYSFLIDTLFKAEEPVKMLAHEISHMLDHYMEFDIDMKEPFWTSDKKYPDTPEGRRDRYRDLRAYYNDPVELEAYLREEIYYYYTETIGLFQYIAKGLVEGENVNYFINDIIEDIIEEFKVNVDPYGYTRWGMWKKRNKRRVIKRVYSAIETLLSHEVEKIVNN